MGVSSAVVARGEALRARLRRVAGEAVGHGDFQRAADGLLRDVLDYDFSAWATVDPASLINTSCVTPGIDHDPDREAQLFEGEFLRDDVNHYAALAAGDTPAATLWTATGGEPSRSWRYRELLAPLGVGDELRAVCVDGAGRCWATVTLYRRAARAAFSQAEADLAAGLAPEVAKGVRLTLLRQAVAHPEGLDEPPGTLLLSGGQVTVTTEAAERWLDRLGGGRLPSAVQAVAARAGDGPASARVAAPDGVWMGLHAAPVKGQDGAVAVIVERLRPAALAATIVDALGLTVREREVVEQVLAGRSTRQAGTALGISPWTVQDHLKAVFAKAGVASRGQLAALLHREHYRPRVRRGVTPGPDGWFLEGGEPA